MTIPTPAPIAALAPKPAKTVCARCGKVLRGTPVFLEYNQRIDTYCRPGTVPAADSLGGFLLGPNCAAKELAKESAPIAAERLAQRDGV